MSGVSLASELKINQKSRVYTAFKQFYGNRKPVRVFFSKERRVPFLWRGRGLINVKL